MVQTICVCGAGTMGSGIAQAAAQHGFSTILFDTDKTMPAKAKDGIARSLGVLVDKNKITDGERQAILARMRFTSDIKDCIADTVIEAIVEKIEAKTSLFSQLASINSAETIFATNTSSLSVAAIAEKIPNPQRVIGMHFFNPATIMKLVEVVTTNVTSASTVKDTFDLALRMNKTPVLCNDAPGFIVNHVARPFYLEALRLVEQGIGDYATIDRLMEASGFKMGPFRLMDLIGNDVNYAVSCSVYEAMNKPARLEPSLIQKQKVQDGELGKKTGRGYYTYTNTGQTTKP